MPLKCIGRLLNDGRVQQNLVLSVFYGISRRLPCFSKIPYNPENKLRGLYFSKALFEGLIFGGAYTRRGLSMEGNLRFKIDWASLIVGSKFTVFALFYFVFEGNFPSTSPRGAYIWRGDLTEGFLRYQFGGLIFGGAYTWRGLFSEFYGSETCPRPYWCTSPVRWHLNIFSCNNFLLFQKTN